MGLLLLITNFITLLFSRTDTQADGQIYKHTNDQTSKQTNLLYELYNNDHKDGNIIFTTH